MHIVCSVHAAPVLCVLLHLFAAPPVGKAILRFVGKATECQSRPLWLQKLRHRGTVDIIFVSQKTAEDSAWPLEKGQVPTHDPT